jgi:hypothetical protein
MHARALIFSAVTAIGFVALASSLPSHAQGALKPVDALIVNSPNRPVPVTVIAPPAAAQPAMVTCRIRFGQSIGSTPMLVASDTITPVQGLDCPSGVTKLDVHRVLFDPLGGATFGSRNVAHFSVMVGIGPGFPSEGGTVSDDEIAVPLAMLTEGAADVSLARPVRIDKSASGMAVMTRRSCSSGIAGFIPTCAGVVFLVGTPVVN